jgi:hypothetical protein
MRLLQCVQRLNSQWFSFYYYWNQLQSAILSYFGHGGSFSPFSDRYFSHVQQKGCYETMPPQHWDECTPGLLYSVSQAQDLTQAHTLVAWSPRVCHPLGPRSGGAEKNSRILLCQQVLEYHLLFLFYIHKYEIRHCVIYIRLCLSE